MRTLVAVLALLFLFPSVSLANKPVKSSKTAQSSVSGSFFYDEATNSSNTVFACFTEDDDSTNVLVPWDATMVMSCNQRVMACYVQDPSAITVAVSGVLTDSGSGATSGKGACWAIEAGTYRPMKNSKNAFVSTTAVGRRSGACTLSGVATGHPCDALGDCPVGDACDTSADRFTWVAGAYLCFVSHANLTPATCSVNSEND